MNKERNTDKKTFKARLRSFSDEVFRNYSIMRMRWTISYLERKRGNEIRDLGNRVFRLIERKKLEIPDISQIVTTIKNLDSDIRSNEERLKDLIISGESPAQITAKSDSNKKLEATKDLKDKKSDNMEFRTESKSNEPIDIKPVMNENATESTDKKIKDTQDLESDKESIKKSKSGNKEVNDPLNEIKKVEKKTSKNEKNDVKGKIAGGDQVNRRSAKENLDKKSVEESKKISKKR